MEDSSNQTQAVELLQQLGLKEYEARSFVALSRRPQGTAREISETSAVPRTRVYDAIRVLESKGLVETQHSNPQRFRAVSIDEAVETLRSEYEECVESLRTTLMHLEAVDVDTEAEETHEVWALSERQGITARTRQLIDDAEEEVVLVIGRDSAYSESLFDHLRAAHERGVSVLVGVTVEELRVHVEERLPEVDVFVSDLEWLTLPQPPGDETTICQLLLVDREAILVSSVSQSAAEATPTERGVFGRGFDNVLVTIVRRLIAARLRGEGPGRDESEPA